MKKVNLEAQLTTADLLTALAKADDPKTVLNFILQLPGVTVDEGPTPIPEAKELRAKMKTHGYRKRNQGIFQTLREYLSDEYKAKRRELHFKQVLQDVKFFYPKITPRLLQIYLNDNRQLNPQKLPGRFNVDFSAKRGTVILR